MARAFDDWQGLVRSNGYHNEADMLRDFYEVNRLSIREIAKMLKQDYSNVKYRLIKYGVDLRDRGGPNHNRETKQK